MTDRLKEGLRGQTEKQTEGLRQTERTYRRTERQTDGLRGPTERGRPRD